jgi:hypothetical protein
MGVVARHPTWFGVWLLTLAVWTVCGVGLLSTKVGRQALVDERVRVVEAFGGTIDDETYERLQAHPPLSAYFTSGGRLMLMPPVTLAVAAGLCLAARWHRLAVAFRPAIAVTVHAGITLALGQVVSTPVHFVRETLTSPFNLAAILPGLDEGTLPARVFGAIDVFALWWLCLIAVGLGALTSQPVRRPLAGLVAVYVGIAIVFAAIQAASGGV